jgi:hypothetical protein
MTTQETDNSTNWREKPNDSWADADYRNAEWLREKYATEGLSGRKIGEMCGVCADTIYKWLDKHGIDSRGRNEQRKNWIDPSDKLIESLEGGLLGDGYMGRQNEGGGAYYQEADTNRTYLDWLECHYSELGLGGWIGYSPQNLGADWRFTSIKAMDLVPVWKRWYGSGEKEIPDEFEITPTKLLFWYVGDGWLSESHGEPTVGISGYDLADKFDMVVDQLQDVGITCSVCNQGIRIWAESHDDFFEYIDNSDVGVPDGYAYKFDI